jgi:hypothetical protein
MTAAQRSRAAHALALILALAGLLAATAAAKPADVVPVSIVTDPATGKAVMRPDTVKATDGDTLKICNRSNVIPSLFSYSKFNVFGRKSGSGERVDKGECTTVVVHNPTGGALAVLIRSEIQNSVALNVTVMPECKQRRTRTAGLSCLKPAAGTYTLVSAKLLENPYGKEVTVNAAASGSATWDHCCDGGKWKTQYTWKFPSTLIPGKPFSIGMSIKTVLVEPSQPFNDQMSALAPDFRQDLPTSYPGQPSASKTYSVPFSEGYRTDPNNKTLKLYVSAAHATVVLTYRRT